MGAISLLIPIPFSIIACYTDIKTRKIKNNITYPLILLGVFSNGFLNGFEGLKASILGAFFILFLSSLVKGFKLGGGDLKLGMGYGVFLKYDKILMFYLLFITFITIGNIIYFIYDRGLKIFICELKGEIKTLGGYRTEFKKIIGAPVLFVAYISTVLIYYYF